MGGLYQNTLIKEIIICTRVILGAVTKIFEQRNKFWISTKYLQFLCQLGDVMNLKDNSGYIDTESKVTRIQ
jgi:hypothetical protein